MPAPFPPKNAPSSWFCQQWSKIREVVFYLGNLNPIDLAGCRLELRIGENGFIADSWEKQLAGLQSTFADLSKRLFAKAVNRYALCNLYDLAHPTSSPNGPFEIG